MKVKPKKRGDAGKNVADAKAGKAARPSPGDKKAARKAAFLQNVAQAHKQRLTLAGGIKKKKRAVLPSLSTLGEALSEVDASLRKPAAGKPDASDSARAAKQRVKICKKEVSRMQQVLAHPIFKEDPIKAITNHLNNVLPPPPQPGKATSGKAPSKKAKKVHK